MSRGELPYISHIGMCRPEGYIYIFFSRFGLKTGLHFAHFGLESGIVFDGTTGVYERICYFSSKMNTEKGRVIYKFEVGRVTIWRTRRHTPQGALAIFVCNHNLKISNLCGSKISLFCTQKVHWVQTPFCLENIVFFCNDCS